MSSPAPDNGHNINGSSHNSNGRPSSYGRSQTETDLAHGATGMTETQRSLLERNWSTSRIQDESTRMVSSERGARRHTGSSEPLVLGEGWASGFGESWTSFDTTGRNATILPASRTSQASALDGSARRNTAGVSSAMHDAARLADWNRVKEICQENPSSASFIGQGGYTALHHVCSRRCPHPEVFEAVIQACPDALLIEETKGWTPLHLACRFKCKNEAVKKLLTLFPQKGRRTVSKPDKQRRTPLYYAVRYDAPAGVVPQVLEADPSVVLADDQNLQSPLALVWDDFAEKLEGCRALNPFIGEQRSESTPEDKRERLEKTSELFKNWKQANLFLKAAFGFPLDEEHVFSDTAERKWRVLHATAAVKCHPSLFQMACALYPEQARELDDNDLYGQLEEGEGSRKQTALHLAASSIASGATGKAVLTELLRLYPEAARTPDEIDGSYPLHRISENKHKQHWTFDGANPIYMMHPAAAQQVDRNGKLPLHRAAASIAHQHGDAQDAAADLATRSIICNLLQVHPQGAAARDGDGCHPLHLTAIHGGDWTDEVRAVLDGHPAAVSVRTGRGLHNSLPIHLAAANPNATGTFIQNLVELNPRGVAQEDGQGKLPLHLACELGKKWKEEGVEAIHNAFAHAVSTRERNGRQWLALHMASASEAPCGELINQLVDLYPEACQLRDSKGRLPFHLACEAGKKWEEGLSALFEGNPAAIAAIDSEGRLPLYIVADQIATAAAANAIDADDRLDGTLIGETSFDAIELDVLYNLVRSDPTTIPEID